MKIKLVQTGGLLPVTKVAELTVRWTNHQVEDFCMQVALSNQHSSLVRDGIYFTLEIDNRKIPVNPANITGKHAEMFRMLVENLKIVKI